MAKGTKVQYVHFKDMDADHGYAKLIGLLV